MESSGSNRLKQFHSAESEFLQPCDLGALLRMREEAGALLKAIASPSWQQLLSSVQLKMPSAQKHAMAVRRFEPISLVSCVSELLNGAALCEWAAPNEAH